MKELCCIDVSMQHYVGPCHVKVWEHGDPMPVLGPSVGVDTETERFTDTMLDPPVVVLGVFDPTHETCWVVYWYDVCEFMHMLNISEVQQRYFNVGFDEMVLDNEDLDKTLLDAVEAGRVRDMQVRIHIHDVATIGWIQGNHYSLAGCSLHYLNIKLDKGEDDVEHSARMTFKRYNEDGTPYRITDEQAHYLPYDCITTWCLGEHIPEQPTEIQHTKGMIVLAHISRNGAETDDVVFSAMEQKLFKARDAARLNLLTFGFPDPYRDGKTDAALVRKGFSVEYKKLLESEGLEPGLSQHVDLESLDNNFDEVNYDIPKKANLRLMLTCMWNATDDPADKSAFVQDVKWACEHEKPPAGKVYKSMYAEVCEKYDLLAFDASSKGIVMPALLWKTMEALNKQCAEGAVEEKGWQFGPAVEYASAYLDEHAEWLTAAEQVGPRKFFQEHVKSVLAANPKLELETTPKSGDVKLTLKDRWRLEDAGVEDKFLDAFIAFNHCQKYLSTYLNRDLVKADHKVHPRFTNYLRTGRTSCTNPNIQNYPSRDKVYPLKNIFKPYDGMILCATDFSFIELCAFAQTCYSRFGFSVMRDVINAGLDPHRWFAGVMEKIITPDLSKKDDPQWVEDTKKFLKEHVSDASRQKAKAANFGSEVSGLY